MAEFDGKGDRISKDGLGDGVTRRWGEYRNEDFGVQEEKTAVKRKNVEKGEGIFRLIAGIVLIISAFFISGIFRWILGPIGLVVILTAIFGY